MVSQGCLKQETGEQRGSEKADSIDISGESIMGRKKTKDKGSVANRCLKK
jgi:hypothetical protein